MSLEFVLHLHSGQGAAHYDLMLQYEAALATWQFDADPSALEAGKNMPCQRIQDHRTFYLSYQGPLSNNRGQVAMLDFGQYEPLQQDRDRWLVRLAGRRLAGLYELARVVGPSDACVDAGVNDWLLLCVERS